MRTLLTGSNSYCYNWMLHILQVLTSLSIWHHYTLNELLAKLFWRFSKSLMRFYSMLWKQNSFIIFDIFQLESRTYNYHFSDILWILILFCIAEQILFPFVIYHFFTAEQIISPHILFIESRTLCYVVLLLLLIDKMKLHFLLKNNIILN